MSGTAAWQNLAAPSGDWSSASDWSTGVVPTVLTDVAIGPGLAGTATVLTVTATTDEAAASLLLQVPAFTLGITLSVSGSLAVGGLGSLRGGTLQTQNGTLTFGTLSEGGDPFGAAMVTLGTGGVLAVAGTLAQASGTIALNGATLTAAAATLQGWTTLGTGAAATVGALSLGLEADSADPTRLGGAGTLGLARGSTLAAGSLDLLAGSVLRLDAASAVAVAGASAVAGALAVGAGGTLLAPSGTIDGNIVLAGLLDVAFPYAGFADPGTLLDIAGTLTGAGSLDVPAAPGTAGRVEIGNATGFAGHVFLAPHTDLTLLSGDLRGTAAQFLGATIDLRGQTYDAAEAPGYDAASGLLTLGATTLDVGTGLAAGQFVATADAFGGTAIRMVDAATWTGPGGGPSSGPGGDWGNAAGWSGGSVPDARVTVAIGPGVTGTAWTVTATNESAAALDLAMTGGTLALGGSFALADTLAMRGGVLLATAAALTEGGAARLDGGAQVTLGGAADWQLGAPLVIGSGTLDLAGGSTLSAAALTLSGAAAIALDATSRLLVGAAQPVGGDVAVAAGASLVVTGTATLAAGLAEAGLLRVDGGLAVEGDLANSGTVLVGGSLTLAGTLSATGGTLAVTGTNAAAALSAGAMSIGAGGAVVVDNGAITLGSDTLSLAGGAALVVGGSGSILADLAGAGMVSVGGAATIGALTGFGGTLAIGGRSTLDLPGVAYGGQAVAYDAATGAASVGGLVLRAPAGLAAGLIAARADPLGGLEIAIPCFVAGTRILCEEGERPVEMLRPGDRVVTAGGRVAPVRWVGWTTIDLTRHPAPAQAAPVRIRADALAPGRPRRDLCVSPDHALWLGGRLVPARLLVNGATIARTASGGRISYMHVELDRHDLLLAEAVAAESYLDTGNRGQFAGVTGVRALFPDRAAPPDLAARRAYAARGAAPLARQARGLRARLLARALALGWRLTGDPDLRIIADAPGTAAVPVGSGGVHVFLPPGACALRLLSRTFVPDALDPCAGDGRSLGVALAVRRNGRPLAAATYAGGWHAKEPGCVWRWTDGDAHLRLTPRAREVRITVSLLAAGARYWLAPEEAAAPNRAA